MRVQKLLSVNVLNCDVNNIPYKEIKGGKCNIDFLTECTHRGVVPNKKCQRSQVRRHTSQAGQARVRSGSVLAA